MEGWPETNDGDSTPSGPLIPKLDGQYSRVRRELPGWREIVKGTNSTDITHQILINLCFLFVLFILSMFTNLPLMLAHI